MEVNITVALWNKKGLKTEKHIYFERFNKAEIQKPKE